MKTMSGAVNLYVTTCRAVFQSSPDDSNAWTNVYSLLGYLRESLKCSVCGNLMVIPMSSTVSSCQHHACKMCLGGKMRVKPACPHCKDRSKFSENVQMRIVLQCYKKMCQYLTVSSLKRRWGSLNGGTDTNLADIVEEGSKLEDTFRYDRTSPRNSKNSPRSNSNNQQTSAMNGERSRAVINGNRSSRMSRKRPTPESNNINSSSDNQSSDSGDQSPKRICFDSNSVPSTSSSAGGRYNSTSSKKKRGCRCGMATPNPGKLTCCGQRCPCYVDGKSCSDCQCRGCRNPNKRTRNDSSSDSSKKLNSDLCRFDVAQDIHVSEAENSDIDVDG